jgi:hypothetical protein
MHILYLFVIFSFLLTINIVRDLFNSDIQKIEITRIDLLVPSIGALIFWSFYTFSGKLSKTINKNYED